MFQLVNFALRVHELHKSYPGRSGQTALRPLSFDVAAGESAVLLGPNGAGKTTLFKILATLIRPDGGEAWVAGHPLSESLAVRRSIGMVSDPDRSFFWRLNARENLEFFASAYGLCGRDGRERIEELLGLLDLVEFRRRAVGKLSAGQRGRLALARALLHRPPVLLLDEPTRSLDPTAAAEFLALLQRYLTETPGASVLLATHRLDAIAPFCRRLIILKNGALAADGSPEALLRQANLRPQSSAVENLAALYAHHAGPRRDRAD